MGGLAAGGLAGTVARKWMDRGKLPPAAPPSEFLDDASTLNPTRVRGVVFASSAPESTADALRPLLRRVADGADPALAVSGVRHSMGGQSLLADGWILETQPMRGVTVDAASGVMRVGAGVTWREVIPVLNRLGLAPHVMQSNHDFTVGGSLSVNCHGLQVDHAPISGTVRRLRLLTGDGDVLTCSPTENPELFRHALGGYGLFGVILDAELGVVPNALYAPGFVTTRTRDYLDVFKERVYAPNSDVEMAYGRLSVDPDNLLDEAIIVTLVPVPGSRGTVLPLSRPGRPELTRAIFRNSADNEFGKKLRWWLERDVGPRLAGRISRNSLLDEPARIFSGASGSKVDVLQEYFIPQTRLPEFVQAARDVIRRTEGNLLNVTVRDVRRDDRSVLAYACQDVFGLVMLFEQDRSPAGERRMRTMTRELVDAAIAVGGSFYLPYRLHATLDQLGRAYPAWEKFVDAKHRFDPRGVFRNGLFERYAPS
ncbi:FAD-binding oxidoreductase [Allokutzneria albata]|uniref:FAD-binding oxidoreductase n=1 Tax=Allokutzneria albata TaxID=211114 RepID=UPI00138E356D|nr:FAD-binding oxidoreductase [Allokutzneria albata]